MKSPLSSTVLASVNSRSTSVVSDPLRGVSTTSPGRITKSSVASQETEAETVEQMRVCFARLEELVSHDATGSGSHRRSQAEDHSSRVQLLQNVIDYILDLESTLDFRPDDAAMMPSQQSSANGWRFNFNEEDENIEGAECRTTEVQKKISSDFIDCRGVTRPPCSDRLHTDAAVFGTC